METALRQPDIAEVFERVLVPAIFEPYARDLVGRARPIGPSDRVLDLGCGTGIVARVLRERLGGAARITGIDVSARMIEKARSLAPEIEWHEGNALELPFAERSFDVVLCQQMLQFVPDLGKALREIRRILVPRGRLVASAWRSRGEQPLHDSLGRIAERHLGKPNDKRFALEGERLCSAIADAGFTDIRLESVSLTERYGQFPIRMSVMAANFDLAALEDSERERRLLAIESESHAALARFENDGALCAPSITNVVTAASPA
jgi:ubiquinone/menaquinone biosynthesis C-methylase UbiE